MNKIKSFKQRMETCRFCQEEFLTGGNGKQTVCLKSACREKLKAEWYQREQERKLARKERVPASNPKRLCLKCDLPIRDGYLCENCRRENAESYGQVEVWGTRCFVRGIE